MARAYTHHRLQEHLREHGVPENRIREAISAAMTNISRSAVIKFPVRQRIIVYVAHDRFELR